MKKINVPFALSNGGTTRGRKGGCFSCPAPLSPGLEAGLESKLGSQNVQSTTRHEGHTGIACGAKKLLCVPHEGLNVRGGWWGVVVLLDTSYSLP